LEFWQSANCAALCRDIFPIGELPGSNAFIAPELLSGTYDERSNVYVLGAILYLLLTHYAPSAAIYRMQASNDRCREKARFDVPHLIALGEGGGLELIAPHHLYHGVTPAVEQVLLRALELDPGRRYPSVFALVEALEGIGG
jgi:serine/threonine protein kinase